MIIKVGKKAKIIFKAGSRWISEVGLWLEASILDHSGLFIPEEIKQIYKNKQFGKTILVKDYYGNDYFLPEEEIEEIEYL